MQTVVFNNTLFKLQYKLKICLKKRKCCRQSKQGQAQEHHDKMARTKTQVAQKETPINSSR